MIRPRLGIVLVVLILALIATFFWGIASGSVSISLHDLYRGMRAGDPTITTLIFEIRLPRFLLSAIVGGALSVAGAAFQGLFRNSLADPYIIGASSGAALGAGIAMAAGVAPLALYAGGGSVCAVLLAFVIARFAGNPPPATSLLLAGTSISALCSAALSLILIVKDQNLNRVYYWLLGSLTGASWQQLAVLAPVMLVGFCTVWGLSARLDLLMQGEDIAQSLGVPVQSTRILVTLGASISVAAAVSVAGIIGFVGLAAPHAARAFTGPAHKRLLPVSALAGMVLLTASDIISRSIAPPLEIPVGIITSLGGAPFFLYLLVRFGRRSP
jgi:iron complex transport system permease protein